MLAALGSKLYVNASRKRESNDKFFVDLANNSERSSSINRGREILSTGRGGLGNLRAASTSRDARPNSGPDDFSPTRGREPHVRHTEALYSTGRGGTGNIRSPSREPSKPDPTEASDENIVRQHMAADEAVLHSSGRGGLGNISRSRSRDPYKPNASSSTFHSSGRGGAGNIHPGAPISETVDEEERQKLGHPDSEIHSTGRGGSANIASTHLPNIEHHKHEAHGYESTGRGGTGNIHS